MLTVGIASMAANRGASEVFYLDIQLLVQVGNLTDDRLVWERPEEMTMRRPTYYISTRNGTSDLGGQMVGAFVASAMVFQQTDPDYYSTLMQAAVNLYGAGTRFQGL